MPASAATKDPASKVFITEVTGDNAFVQYRDQIQPLVAKRAYLTQGMTLETKSGTTVTAVFSNGTALKLAAGTRIEVKRFTQDPFKPDRADMAVEPSISDAVFSVISGTVVISTSILVAGSSLTVQTAHGDLNVHGGTLIVSADDNASTVTVAAGSCTVYGSRPNDFDQVRSGESAEIRPAPTTPSTPTAGLLTITVSKVPESQKVAINDQSFEVQLAKKTVYFEVKKPDLSSGTERNAPAIGSSNGDGSPAPVTAFESTAGESGAERATAEIIATPVVPSQLPVEFTVSPARLLKPPGT